MSLESTLPSQEPYVARHPALPPCGPAGPGCLASPHANPGVSGPAGQGCSQPALDRRRRPVGPVPRGRRRPPGGDPEPRRAGPPGGLVRPGVLQLAALHAQPPVVHHGTAPPRGRRDPAGDAAAGECADPGELARRAGLPDRGHRQDALQRPVHARVRDADRRGPTGSTIFAGIPRRGATTACRSGRSSTRPPSGSTPAARTTGFPPRRWSRPTSSIARSIT